MDSDLTMMSLCIFVPSIFAIVLLFFPKRCAEYMRWWALLGTAVTFVISMVLFIDYLGMMDSNRDGKTGKIGGAETTMQARAQVERDVALKGGPRSSTDLMGRVPWVSTFNIDYFLGVDGISMPLILLTTILFMLAMIASWNIEKYVKGYCALFLL